MMDHIDPALWPIKYPLIAHDVARTNDRSTAVVGGYCSLGSQGTLGIKEIIELPRDCYGHALANQLAVVDGRCNRDAVIVADLSSDASYGELLSETFGKRVIGVQIGSGSTDGTEFETRRVRGGVMRVYQLSRTYLFDLLLREFRSDRIRLPDGQMGKRAFEQLTALEVEQKDNRVRYICPPGRHDDLAISCAMLAWAAQHPHFKELWVRAIEDRHRPRARPQDYGWKAFV